MARNHPRGTMPKKPPSKRNGIAAILRIFKPKVVKSKKAYKRRPKHKDKE